MAIKIKTTCIDPNL